jgi:hypothetical protein
MVTPVSRNHSPARKSGLMVLVSGLLMYLNCCGSKVLKFYLPNEYLSTTNLNMVPFIPDRFGLA